MSRAEKIKEQIGFIKFWLVSIGVGIFGIIGWLFVNVMIAPLWQILIATLALIPSILAIICLVIITNKKLKELERE